MSLAVLKILSGVIADSLLNTTLTRMLMINSPTGVIGAYSFSGNSFDFKAN